MSLVKKLAGQTAIYGLSSILSRVLFYMVFTVYLTRALENSKLEFGIYTDMYSYSTIILTILTLRMETAFFRYASRSDDKKTVFSSAFIPVLLFGLLVLTILLPNASRLASALSYGEAPHYIQWFGLILFFDALASLIFAKLRLENRPMRFLIYKVVNVVATILLVLFFMEIMPKYFPGLSANMKSTLGIRRTVDFVFFSNLIASALIFLGMLPEMKLRWKVDWSLFKQMIIYSAPLIIVGIAGNINQAFAAPLQKYFLGKNVLENLPQVGVYGAAAKLAIFIQLCTTAFNYAAEPFFFNNAGKEDSKSAYGKIALAFTLVTCLVALGIVSYIDIFMLILGPELRGGQHVVPILLMAYVLLGIYYNISIWYKLADKTIYGAMISVIGAIVTLAVSITLLPKIGTVASAYAAFACYMTMNIIGYFLGQKHYPIDYPIRKIVFYFIATMILAYLIVLSSGWIDNQYLDMGIKTVILGLIALYLWKKEFPSLLKA